MSEKLTAVELEMMGGPNGPWTKDDWDGLIATVEVILAARLARVEALANRLERRARWRFKAGQRLWVASGYGKGDNWESRPGERALRMCGVAGQMERDAKWFREQIAALRSDAHTEQKGADRG